MKEKIENISNRYTALGIRHQKELTQDTNPSLMQRAAYIDHLQHAAYEAIEEQYSQFTPNASKDEQVIFLKEFWR